MRSLVTGASSGIGREFAHQLAQRGDDLVVVARTQARLDELADELRGQYDIAVEVLAADLTAPEDLAAVSARVATADPDVAVDTLVNSAGYGAYGAFLDLDAEFDTGQIALNVVALATLCRAALPLMAARGSGSIVNISSVSSVQPMPYHATYGATKAFVSSYSQALAEELRGSSVRVLAVNAGYTHTEFHDRAGVAEGAPPEILWMEPSDVVTAALHDLERGRTVCTPGLLNRVLATTSRLAPPSVSAKVSARLSRRFR